MNESIQDELLKALRRLTYATVVIFVALAGLAAFVWVDTNHKQNDLRRLSESTNGALCTLRVDLEQRVQTSQEFLAQHPKGIPGIPVATIQQSLEGQQRTVRALANLNCEGS